MKYVIYNGQTTTADDVADAVVECAAVLGLNNRTGTIDVPTLDENRQGATETLLIGLASQITINPARGDELEDDRDEFMRHRHDLAAVAGPASPAHHENRHIGALIFLRSEPVLSELALPANDPSAPK